MKYSIALGHIFLGAKTFDDYIPYIAEVQVG